MFFRHVWRQHGDNNCAHAVSLDLQRWSSSSWVFPVRYLEVLLRRATVNVGHIVHSPRQKAFVTVAPIDGQRSFVAEEYADLSELRALAELIGPYGMRYLGERLMLSVASQVDELKVGGVFSHGDWVVRSSECDDSSSNDDDNNSNSSNSAMIVCD